VDRIHEFVAEYGELPKPKGVCVSQREKNLAYFINHQKRKNRKRGLSNDKIEALESIPGFDWISEKFDSHVEVRH
jgi:hypothetical protein